MTCILAPGWPQVRQKKCKKKTAANGTQARHQSHPSAITATPATQSEGRCPQVPRLPRKTKVSITKWHACHAKCCGDAPCRRPNPRSTSAQPLPEVGGPTGPTWANVRPPSGQHGARSGQRSANIAQDRAKLAQMGPKTGPT